MLKFSIYMIHETNNNLFVRLKRELQNFKLIFIFMLIIINLLQNF
jgi:hypothetical protein